MIFYLKYNMINIKLIFNYNFSLKDLDYNF
jgi:hypothetical protein